MVTTFRSIAGLAPKKSCRRRASHNPEKAGEQHRVRLRLSFLSRRIRSVAWKMLSKDNCAASNSVAPAAVRETSRPVRLNSSVPRYSSRSRICRLIAAWVTHSDSAARVKLRYLAAATNERTALNDGMAISD